MKKHNVCLPARGFAGVKTFMRTFEHNRSWKVSGEHELPESICLLWKALYKLKVYYYKYIGSRTVYMLFSFNEQWSILCWGKLNSPKGAHLEWWKRLILKATRIQVTTKACAWRSLSLAKMISNNLDSMQNKRIVSRKVKYTKRQQCVANNAKWQQHPSSPLSAKLRLVASWWLATPVFCLIVMMKRVLSLFSFCSLSPIFASFYSLVFFTLLISCLGILPCIIHEWHACFTHHVPTAMLCRPKGVFDYASL